LNGSTLVWLDLEHLGTTELRPLALGAPLRSDLVVLGHDIGVEQVRIC
jgi:hypothetical protein